MLTHRLFTCSLCLLLTCSLYAASLKVEVVGDFLVLEQSLAGGDRSAAIARDALVSVEKGVSGSYTTLIVATAARRSAGNSNESRVITFQFPTQGDVERAFRAVVKALGELSR